MRVLLTGGAGYIGSVTAHELVRDGHEVVVLDNLSRGHRAAVPAAAELVVGEHGDRALLDRVLAGVECVMHFSAHSQVGESMEQPARYFRNNVADGLTLLECMVEANVPRIIFSSSAATYGEPARVPITEETPAAPTNPYGESKRMFEQLLHWFDVLHEVRFVALRYFNAAGAIPEAGEDHTPESHLIPIVLEVAAGRRNHVCIFGDDYPTADGTCVRDYIHVKDLARAHIQALAALAADGASGVFNLGNGNGFSVREVVEVARRVTGRPIPIEVAPRRPGDPGVLVASATRARRDLGWAPRHAGLEDMIGSAWDWMQAHPEGYDA